MNDAPHPAQLIDALSGYCHLTDVLGIPSSRIVIIGACAGGTFHNNISDVHSFDFFPWGINNRSFSLDAHSISLRGESPSFTFGGDVVFGKGHFIYISILTLKMIKHVAMG